jgi:hypothetical protein
MAIDRGASVEPPADLAQRELLLKTLRSKPWWRIYRNAHGPCFFSGDTGNRFSSAKVEVLYLADKPETSFWEIFWDDVVTRPPGDRRISKKKLQERQVCAATIKRRLRIFNATHPGALKAVSAPSPTFSGGYAQCQAWAAALLAHPSRPDGILYESARSKRAQCLALFAERVECADIHFESENATSLAHNALLMSELSRSAIDVIE